MSDKEGIDRREAIAALGFGAMAAHVGGSTGWARFREAVAAGRHAAFFTTEETALVTVLADLIIPRDTRSGSATDSGAVPYMDFVVGGSSPKTQQAWRDGLRWYDEECQRRFGKRFVACSTAQQKKVLDDVAWPDRAPEALKPQAQFFNRLRDLTGSAFFSSKMGVHDLGYIGNVPNPDWQGAPPAALKELGVSYAEWDAKYGGLK